MESATVGSAQSVISGTVEPAVNALAGGASQTSLFISRSGADVDIAAQIGHVLEAAGYGVILQQWDFGNRHFIERMHEALAGGTRVVALLSPQYLRSDHCQAEWMNAIAGDPLNRNGRLILLRVAECEPPGMLAGLAFWDLVPILDNPPLLAEMVRKAVSGDSRDSRPAPSGQRPTARRAIPSGTVTFLFTDIEGSTQRWDRNRAAMEAAVRRHDAIMREAIDRHRGFVFKTIGDAFCAAFSGATDAIAAALDAQTSLAEEDFTAVDGVRVRMAIHTGTADEREFDYFGPAVNRVARLLSIGHGGQVLLSEVSAELAQSEGDLPGLRDMGTHRLKDLSDPEHVFQLDVPGGLVDFPTLRSMGAGQNNLPVDPKSFVGREADVAKIEALLGQGGLVTLVGSGGVGKTSCALRAASGLVASYADGVWFVGLAATTDPALVAVEVAAVFRLVESAKRPAIDTLTTHLRNKNTLILLDNCEHLIDACSQLASTVLRTCPGVTLLTTSREALKVSGERVYHLPTLSVPARDVDVTFDDALSYGAIALFVARAQAADSRFSLTPQNLVSVVEICRRLDGIPLALELAAARIRVLAPRQLEQKLNERFRLLTGGSRTALPRQQTMRALIDWSYDLLDEREQALLCALSIFTGSFSLESAMAVCVSETIEEFEMLDGLTSLVEKSLVVADASESDMRYRLLESMREYGRERLTTRGTRLEMARRHAAAYAELAERLEEDYGHTLYRTWVANAEAEIENVRAALGWTFGPDGDVEVGLRLAGTLRRIFDFSRPAEARRWVQTALGRVGAGSPPGVVARLELADAHLASRLNQFNAALASARHAIAGFEADGDERGAAIAKRWAGRSLVFLGDVREGEMMLRSALDAYAALGMRKVGGLLLDLGSARSANGDIENARDLFARALKQFEEDQDEGNVAVTAGMLAEAEFHGGDADAAVRHSQDALAAARGLNRHISLWLQSNMAAFLIALDRFDQALQCIGEALQTALHLESELLLNDLLQHIAAILVLGQNARTVTMRTDEFDLAARLAGYVDNKFRELDVTREFTERQEYDRMMAALTSMLGVEPLAARMAEGGSLPQRRVIELAATAAGLRLKDAGLDLARAGAG